MDCGQTVVNDKFCFLESIVFHGLRLLNDGCSYIIWNTAGHSVSLIPKSVLGGFYNATYLTASLM